jgi:hypothetical protein
MIGLAVKAEFKIGVGFSELKSIVGVLLSE